ncbi:TRM11 family SAM-dependent methyltransferase, partial [Candidatus Venteria ishoeyi]|uniref:TRM11 family SAM-dependent methyltransferase n=1 Tax=Candidatus Venteria ishoeyi TaxID=1899563 RepID=UPI000CDE9FB5
SEGFKVEYFVFDGDTSEYAERLKKLRDIGYSIEGIPDYHNPTTTYALCNYEGIWCFGNLIKNKFDWYKHIRKPCSYSNSININIAKALVNIASKTNKEIHLLDACCGVGTIMLEACFAGYKIDGCDNNRKICKDARENLSHFNYSANIVHSDIKDISKNYVAAIIDLPYNLFSSASDTNVLHIIESTAKIAKRLVIVSTSNITDFISTTGFRISDQCSVGKSGKRKFARKIWVCEK